MFRWSGPFTISEAYSHGDLDLKDDNEKILQSYWSKSKTLMG
jgi:hypothetical protein